MVHNPFMRTLLLCLLLWLVPTLALAQATTPADREGSSEQVEESDEAFRRRMELEDARRRDPGYTPPAASQQKALEKIDKLPAESRDNIRDQLVDIIMENGEWEPSDVLAEYPYEPTAAAQADSELMQQEQEAWDEQVEKYHQREAEAFGAYRGAPPGPGAPGQENGEQSGAAGGESGARDGQGGQSGASGSVGSYDPYEANRSADDDQPSTAGAQQSALDFLRGQAGESSPPADPGATGTEEATAQAESLTQADGAPQAETATEAAAEATMARETPGIIAIEDLEKLQGTEIPEDDEDSETPR